MQYFYWILYLSYMYSTNKDIQDTERKGLINVFLSPPASHSLAGLAWQLALKDNIGIKIN
jgi:hypothetical protein